MSRPRPACTLRVQHPRHPTGPVIRHGRQPRAPTTTRCIRIHAPAARVRAAADGRSWQFL